MPKLTLVVDNTKNRSVCNPDPEPPLGAAAVKPYVNDDRVMRTMVLMARTLGLSICITDRVYHRGKKLNGPLDVGKMRIYLSKHLKGRKLRFVLTHELAHFILHVLEERKLGPRYWKDPAYHEQLEKEADDYAVSWLERLDALAAGQQIASLAA